MATNPLFDTKWNLVKSKSKFTTESWNPDTENRIYREVPGGYKLTVSGIKAGKPYSWDYTAIYDGNDHPVNGRADVDAIEAYRVNDQITIGYFKKNGDIVALYHRDHDPDGSTLKVITSGINSDGTIYFDSTYYEAT